MDVELCFTCEKIPGECSCRPPGPIAVAMTTEPHHWAEPARSYLFSQEQIARDHILQRRRA